MIPSFSTHCIDDSIENAVRDSGRRNDSSFPSFSAYRNSVEIPSGSAPNPGHGEFPRPDSGRFRIVLRHDFTLQSIRRALVTIRLYVYTKLYTTSRCGRNSVSFINSRFPETVSRRRDREKRRDKETNIRSADVHLQRLCVRGCV